MAPTKGRVARPERR